MKFYYNGEVFLLGGEPWAKALYNSELVRGVLMGMGVDLADHPVKKQRSYLRDFLPKTTIYNPDELRELYRERYLSREKSLRTPVNSQTLNKLVAFKTMTHP